MKFITDETKRIIGPFSGETGSILIIIVLLVALLAFIPVGTKLLEISRKQVKLQANANAQAVNMARAGLTDAEAWFRMQTIQPVGSTRLGMAYPDAAFYPRQSTGTASSATIDESIGLVKEMKLGETTNLWGRYEVVRQSTNNVTLPSSNNTHTAHDVTPFRTTSAAGEGLAWYIESAGYVYQRKSAAAAYNQSPNALVGRARVSTELRRMALTYFPAAVAVTNRNNRSTSGTIYVRGGANGWGVAYNSGGTAWTTGVTGTPQNQSTSTFTMDSVFGLSANQLKMIADYSVTSVAQLPPDFPSTALVYIDGDATFDNSRPLSGGGVLIVNGNLTIQSSANAYFSGLVFVQGDATIYGPASINGTLMVVGNGSSPDITLDGSSGVAEVNYDKSRLDSIRQSSGQYRQNKSAFHVFSVFD